MQNECLLLGSALVRTSATMSSGCIDEVDPIIRQGLSDKMTSNVNVF